MVNLLTQTWNNILNGEHIQNLARQTGTALAYKPNGIGPFNPAAFRSAFPNPGVNSLQQTFSAVTIIPTDIRLRFGKSK